MLERAHPRAAGPYSSAPTAFPPDWPNQLGKPRAGGPTSAVKTGHACFGVALTRCRTGREGFRELGAHVLVKPSHRSVEVRRDVTQSPTARDRHDVLSLSKQPRQRELRRSQVKLRGFVPQRSRQLDVVPQAFFREPRIALLTGF